MGFLSSFFSSSSGERKEGGATRTMEDDDIVLDHLPLLSSIADSVLSQCSRIEPCLKKKEESTFPTFAVINDGGSRYGEEAYKKEGILLLSLEELQRSFRTELPDHVKHHTTYARNLVEYCSLRTIYELTKRPDHLAEKEFRLLTFDMMLAWEAPDAETESSLNEKDRYKHPEIYEDDGSLFYTCATSMAIQVDYKKTVGLEAFARIAPFCPAIADPITVHNLFDALTCSSGGQLHFLIYDKYLKSLDKVLNSAKRISGPPHTSSLHLAEGEIILDMDGFMPTNPILQHIGISTWPGRLTLTNYALYFEPFGVVSHDKAARYDMEKDLKQVIKRELTGPWGARLFDNAVMYKSSSLAEPIFLEFPQLIGHLRRDYWFAIIREVLHVHKFIRKFNLKQVQQEEALSKAALGIFRYRAVKEAFHLIPSHFRTTLTFNLTEKLPKGDKIMDALYKHLEHLCSEPELHNSVEALSDEKHKGYYFPVSLYALSRLGFSSLKRDGRPEEREFSVAYAHVGETSALQKAVKESVCYSGRVEAARSTLDQVKVEDIETNLAVIQELLHPFTELGKRLLFLAEWEDTFKSTMFLFFILYVVYRGWFRYVLPCTFLSCALVMLWQKNWRKGKQMEAFQITPPPNRNPVELLLLLQESVSQLETHVQTGCIVLLKLRAILFAAFPQSTNKVAFALVGTAAVFALLPFRLLLFVVLLEVYTRRMPLRKHSSEKLVRRIKEWWFRIPAAPVQLIRHQELKKSK